MRKKRKVSRVMGWLLSLQLSEPGEGVCWAVSMDGASRASSSGVNAAGGKLHVSVWPGGGGVVGAQRCMGSSSEVRASPRHPFRGRADRVHTKVRLQQVITKVASSGTIAAIALSLHNYTCEHKKMATSGNVIRRALMYGMRPPSAFPALPPPPAHSQPQSRAPPKRCSTRPPPCTSTRSPMISKIPSLLT